MAKKPDAPAPGIVPREVGEMPVRAPSLEQLSEIALEYGLDLTDQDLDSFRGLMGPILASYARLDQLAEPALPVRYPRLPGYRPNTKRRTPSTPGTGRAPSR